MIIKFEKYIIFIILITLCITADYMEYILIIITNTQKYNIKQIILYINNKKYKIFSYCMLESCCS